ncbi:hypothetical protein VT91_37410 [Clostridium sporogenes]|nr:hypothetical protein VT91_37410 [Clostridium sporogenes]KRU25477.1 hypothetical protein WG71_30540 [Clostridium sporogenes]KRU35140.1 hypothetical protein VT28_01300 [Clostridium sporogenes]KRU42086.1 hypothetical protein VT95_21650 [Clostridium sporogenes]OQP96439.1 hypothetical protein VT92_0223140 [Clostridium sporogenes]
MTKALIVLYNIDINLKLFFYLYWFYPMTTRSNTPIALCESDSHQIEDLDSLLFFKVGVESGYVYG